jgi:hypothetical protein
MAFLGHMPEEMETHLNVLGAPPQRSPCGRLADWLCSSGVPAHALVGLMDPKRVLVCAAAPSKAKMRGYPKASWVSCGDGS